MIRKFLSVVSFKEAILLLYGKLLNTLLIKSKFHSYYLPLYSLVVQYLEEGYNVSTRKGALIVFGKDEYHGKKFLIRPSTSDNHVFKQVIDEKEYVSLIDIIKKESSINSIKTIIDAGANVGYTAVFLNNYFPHSKIICVEADLTNYSQLKKNIEVNLLNKYVCAINNALWDVDNEKLVIKDDFRDGDSWSKRVGKEEAKLNSTHQVNSISLSKLFVDYHLEILDILKIDIEGAEAVLFKCEHFLSMLTKVRFIAIEVHDEFIERKSIEAILLSKGFISFQSGETLFCYNKKLVLL